MSEKFNLKRLVWSDVNLYLSCGFTSITISKIRIVWVKSTRLNTNHAILKLMINLRSISVSFEIKLFGLLIFVEVELAEFELNWV